MTSIDKLRDRTDIVDLSYSKNRHRILRGSLQLDIDATVVESNAGFRRTFGMNSTVRDTEIGYSNQVRFMIENGYLSNDFHITANGLRILRKWNNEH